MKRAKQRPIPASPPDKGKLLNAGAIAHSVLEELDVLETDLGVKYLLEGRIRVYSVDPSLPAPLPAIGQTPDRMHML